MVDRFTPPGPLGRSGTIRDDPEGPLEFGTSLLKMDAEND